VQKLYNLQNALQLETLMNDDIRTFCAELESRFMDGANKGKTCDIADWISFFAWDFLGHMTWSKRIGFMEKGEDVGDMLGTAERVMRYFSVVSIVDQHPQARMYTKKLVFFLVLASAPGVARSCALFRAGRSAYYEHLSSLEPSYPY
tara:strand:- start:37 stop:477 length:441 start_codon:yes stop_codon:yes gene_type:complete